MYFRDDKRNISFQKWVRAFNKISRHQNVQKYQIFYLKRTTFWYILLNWFKWELNTDEILA